ncbi:MAG: hypothetical protein QNJ72_07705 [Pleurocapsa sp. MO_226.B13]|nr:hypothetical protein [Pleurocapsa sp. MO_226.B13]
MMTPEQIEAILESNSRAIASNSDAIAESRRQVSALYQLTAELARDRATMFDILRGMNEDRVRTSENIASLAENVAALNQNVARIAEHLEQREG